VQSAPLDIFLVPPLETDVSETGSVRGKEIDTNGDLALESTFCRNAFFSRYAASTLANSHSFGTD